MPKRESGKATAELVKKFKKSPTEERDYGFLLEDIGVKLRPGTEHRKDSKATPTTSLRCRSLVYKALMELPETHRSSLQTLTLFYTRDGRRGLGGSGTMVLRCLNVTDTELVSVFLHEMGHLVDSGTITGSLDDTMANFSGFRDFGEPVSADDPSAKFYSISWNNESEKKAGATRLDFVSGYAMTDPFEDFAESYALYRIHGEMFRGMREGSTDLAAKYDFMKTLVFGGKEFYGNETNKADSEKRYYDVTVLPFSLAEFLG